MDGDVDIYTYVWFSVCRAKKTRANPDLMILRLTEHPSIFPPLRYLGDRQRHHRLGRGQADSPPLGYSLPWGIPILTHIFPPLRYTHPSSHRSSPAVYPSLLSPWLPCGIPILTHRASPGYSHPYSHLPPLGYTHPYSHLVSPAV